MKVEEYGISPKLFCDQIQSDYLAKSNVVNWHAYMPLMKLLTAWNREQGCDTSILRMNNKVKPGGVMVHHAVLLWNMLQFTLTGLTHGAFGRPFLRWLDYMTEITQMVLPIRYCKNPVVARWWRGEILYMHWWKDRTVSLNCLRDQQII